MFMIVQELMTTKPISVQETDDLTLAKALLDHHRFRHLAVTRDGRVVGVISDRDLLRAMAETDAGPWWLREVGTVMTREVVVVRPGTPIRRAAKMMLDHKFGCLPVVNEATHLVGILTETDLVRFAAEMASELDEMEDAICRVS
jgi:CBS domain-containing protein